MPDIPDAAHASSIEQLVEAARATFERVCGEARNHRDYLDHGHHSRPPVRLPHSEYDAAFGEAIRPLVAELATTRAELAIGKRLMLRQRQAFSTHGPACARCMLLARSTGTDLSLKLAAAGETCSRCGALVVVRLPGETDAEFRARLRGTS